MTAEIPADAIQEIERPLFFTVDARVFAYALCATLVVALAIGAGFALYALGVTRELYVTREALEQAKGHAQAAGVEATICGARLAEIHKWMHWAEQSDAPTARRKLPPVYEDPNP